MNISPCSFTAEANGLATVLTTKCVIFPACNVDSLSEEEKAKINGKEYTAIWDTGATNSAVTQRVIDEMSLVNVGFVPTNHAGGEDITPTYFVNIGLPNQIVFSLLKVNRVKLQGADILIGMDIINRGDLSITNVGGKTTFSFRIPSLETIDYTGRISKKNGPIVKEKKIGRNEPCPCGSGKKYKNCHGKNL